MLNKVGIRNDNLLSKIMKPQLERFKNMMFLKEYHRKSKSSVSLNI
jgi:hypothetical protein